jgi:hypothetical protein
MRIIVNGLCALLVLANHGPCSHGGGGPNVADGSTQADGGAPPAGCSGLCITDLAKTTVDTSPLVRNEDALFWEQDGSIVSVPKTGGVVSTITPAPGAGPLFADDTNVYWGVARSFGSGADSVLWRAPLAGGTPVSVGLAVGDLQQLLGDDAALYWFTLTHKENNHSVGGGTVVKLPLEGGPAVTIYQATGDAAPVNGQLHGETIVFLDSSSRAVCSLPKTGGTPTTLLTPPPLTEMVFDDNAVFGLNAHAVVRAPLDGSAPATIATGVGFQLLISDQHANVFWADQYSSSLWRAPLAGGAAISFTSERGSATALTADADHLYWLNGSQFEVKSLQP